MEVTKRTHADITILEPKGKITIGKGDVALRDSIQAALEGGAKKILVDLGSTKKMDSSGMGELVAARAKVVENGAELKLMKLPKKIENVLGVTQLISVYDIYDDEIDALASFD
jgi:anti-sigma B factor antagonist